MKAISFVSIFFLTSLFFIFSENSNSNNKTKIDTAKTSSPDKLVERTVCTLDLVDLSAKKGQFNFIGSLVADSIAVMLKNYGYNTIPNDLWRKKAEKQKLTGKQLLDKEKIIKFAASMGADVVINGVFVVEGEKIVIGVKAYDIFTKRIAVASTEIGPAGIGIYDTIDDASATISRRIREKLKPLPASVITVEREKISVKTRVVKKIISIGKDINVICISKDEGAKIYLGGEKLIGSIHNGKATFKAKAKTVLEITAKKQGYYNKRQSFKIGASDTTIHLKKLYLKPVFLASTYIIPNLPAGAGGSFEYHIFPDILTIEGSAGIYYLPNTYYFWKSNFNISSFVILTRADLLLGIYPLFFLYPVDFPLRIAANGGLSFMYFYINKSSFIGIHLIRPFLGATVEWNLPEGIVYIEEKTLAPINLPGSNMNSTTQSVIAFFKIGYKWKIK